jgi:hypothetical protein
VKIGDACRAGQESFNNVAANLQLLAARHPAVPDAQRWLAIWR